MSVRRCQSSLDSWASRAPNQTCNAMLSYPCVGRDEKKGARGAAPGQARQTDPCPSKDKKGRPNRQRSKHEAFGRRTYACHGMSVKNNSSKQCVRVIECQTTEQSHGPAVDPSNQNISKTRAWQQPITSFHFSAISSSRSDNSPAHSTRKTMAGSIITKLISRQMIHGLTRYTYYLAPQHPSATMHTTVIERPET